MFYSLSYQNDSPNRKGNINVVAYSILSCFICGFASWTTTRQIHFRMWLSQQRGLILIDQFLDMCLPPFPTLLEKMVVHFVQKAQCTI